MLPRPLLLVFVALLLPGIKGHQPNLSHNKSKIKFPDEAALMLQTKTQQLSQQSNDGGYDIHVGKDEAEKGLVDIGLGSVSIPNCLRVALSNASALLEASHSAGLPWELADAEMHSRHIHRHFSLLESLGPAKPKPDGPELSNMEIVVKSCKELNKVGESANNCAMTVSSFLEVGAAMFWGDDKLTAQSAFQFVSATAIGVLGMYFPLGGMVAGIVASFLSSVLWPTDPADDPMAKAMQELAKEVLSAAKTQAEKLLMRDALGDMRIELEQIVSDLIFVPNMMAEAKNDVSARTVLFTFDLMMAHNLGKLSRSLRSKKHSGDTQVEWAASILPIASMMAWQEAELLLEIADHDIGFKPFIFKRLQAIVLSDQDAWIPWAAANIKPLKEKIDGGFGCDLDLEVTRPASSTRTEMKGYNHFYSQDRACFGQHKSFDSCPMMKEIPKQEECEVYQVKSTTCAYTWKTIKDLKSSYASDLCYSECTMLRLDGVPSACSNCDRTNFKNEALRKLRLHWFMFDKVGKYASKSNWKVGMIGGLVHTPLAGWDSFPEVPDKSSCPRPTPSPRRRTPVDTWGSAPRTPPPRRRGPPPPRRRARPEGDPRDYHLRSKRKQRRKTKR